MFDRKKAAFINKIKKESYRYLKIYRKEANKERESERNKIEVFLQMVNEIKTLKVQRKNRRWRSYVS